jgi:hypothetical protein
MAHMIPDTPPDVSTPGGLAESTLWHALNDGLDDDYFVYRNVDVLDADAREGEVDFVVLHRIGGILCVECKGGGVKRGGDGRWTREVDGRTELMTHSPLEQVRKNTRLLIDKFSKLYQRYLGDATAKLPLCFGHALAFPRGSLDDVGMLPAEAERAIVLDAGDLKGVGVWVEQAMRFWLQNAVRSEQELSPADFKRFRQSVIHPPLAIVQRVGAEMDADAAALWRASQEQLDVIRQFFDIRRMAIRGGAGTGKTVLAIEAARQYANDGAAVLLCCFNKALAGVLATSVADGERRGRIDVFNFHKYCAAAHRHVHGEEMHVPQDPTMQAELWSSMAPNYVLEAVVRDDFPRYDAVIVDEAQDFLPTWWYALIESLRDPRHGRLLVFGDDEQDIFGRDSGLPPMASVRLSINFRNTREIAKVVAKLGRNHDRSAPSCPRGETPARHDRRGAGRDRRAISELVQTLVQREKVAPDRIVVLTPHRRDNSCLKDCESLGDVPLASDPGDRAGRVLHTTLGAFKGLESDIVILADVDLADPRCNRRARYVAASRARHRLHVWGGEGWDDPEMGV